MGSPRGPGSNRPERLARALGEIGADLNEGRVIRRTRILEWHRACFPRNQAARMTAWLSRGPLHITRQASAVAC